MMTVGVVAPSSVIPRVELELAIVKLREEGFKVKVHPQVRKKSLFFAGNDDERAGAFFQFAQDPGIDVLWCARGGHGALRLLPLLEKMTRESGVPPGKLLLGYSDATALMEFVRGRWGWATLHGPMLGLKEFSVLETSEWRALMQLLRQEPVKWPWQKKNLRFYGTAPDSAIEAPLVGGNLAVWAALLGTPYAGDASDAMLFFEDVGEPLYRIDRLVRQVALAGDFKRARAVVLGTFQNCEDTVPPVLAGPPSVRNRERMLRAPKKEELKPLRARLERTKVLKEIFGFIQRDFGIPVAHGLPVGHGPGYPPLPLGAKYRLLPTGRLEILEWQEWTLAGD